MQHPDGRYYYEINGKVFNFADEVPKHKGKEVSPNDEPFKTQWAEFTAQAYARARQPLYPAIGDQLDDLYHAGVFSAEMTAKLKKVKDDNPK